MRSSFLAFAVLLSILLSLGAVRASDGAADTVSEGSTPQAQDTTARGIEGTPGAAESFELEGDLAVGRAIFAEQCALCHGDTGNGEGLIYMDPTPRDLRRPEGLVSRDDRELYRVIREGGPALGLSPKMLPWGEILSEEELHGVATFVRSLGEEAGSNEP